MPLALRKSANRYLLELLSDEKARQQYQTLLDRLIGSRCELSRDEWTLHVVPTLLAIGEAVAGRPVEEQKALDFLSWAEVNVSENARGAPRKSINLFQYPPDGPKVSIRLGSIHGVKGETHTATLVLESYQKAHHLKKLLPWLLGKKPKAGSDNSGEDAALIERLKLHYVAMTRPSHLLCLAMLKDTFKPTELDLIRARNWRVIECVAPTALEEAIKV
ncbi:MAG: Conjugative transfer ATP-dependent DNA helicase [uncultured Paraburkholderia sp.]|nr:MAG: Conjugative transfer ATP-dependent DNA helicase [uncultured Paraburkholderia sp.]CAH2946101.1 MAG: Conjugative transfer ATP-dependent DNA helicase [uncultured Paraburkholderia sp.]